MLEHRAGEAGDTTVAPSSRASAMPLALQPHGAGPSRVLNWIPPFDEHFSAGWLFKEGVPQSGPEVGPLRGGPPSSRSTVHLPEQGPANGSKGQVENIFGFTGHMVSVAITEICHYG